MTKKNRTDIPKSITIGGHTISVSVDPGAGRDLEGRLGKCAWTRGEIFVDSDLCDSQQRETLVHEIIEAANGIYDLGMEHHKIQTLSVALHQALLGCGWIR